VRIVDDLLQRNGIEQLLPYLQNLPLVKTIPSVLATTACSLPIAQFLAAARKRLAQAEAKISMVSKPAQPSTFATPARRANAGNRATDAQQSKKRKRMPDSTPSLAEFLGFGSSNNYDDSSPNKRSRVNEMGDSRSISTSVATTSNCTTPLRASTRTTGLQTPGLSSSVRRVGISTPAVSSVEPSTPSFFSRFWAKIATPIRQQIVSDDELLPSEADSFITPITRRIVSRCSELNASLLATDTPRTFGQRMQSAANSAMQTTTTGQPQKQPPHHQQQQQHVAPKPLADSSDDRSLSPDVAIQPATPSSLRKSLAVRRRRELVGSDATSPPTSSRVSPSARHSRVRAPVSPHSPALPHTPLNSTSLRPNTTSQRIFDCDNDESKCWSATQSTALSNTDAFDSFRTPTRFSPQHSKRFRHASPSTPLTSRPTNKLAPTPATSSPLGTELAPLSAKSRRTRSPGPTHHSPRVHGLRSSPAAKLSPLAKMR
jgi:hypothetical protein